jgi:hypothetical protein
VRKRWRVEPQALVDELHSAIERERMAKQRREQAKRNLEASVGYSDADLEGCIHMPCSGKMMDK